jgi:hypothetical protein
VRRTLWRLGVLIALAVLPMGGQEKTDVAPPPSARFPAAWYPPDNDVTSTIAPVTGAPYTARAVPNSHRTASPVEQQPLQARDSAGRMRGETLEIRLKDGKPVAVRSVQVDDPVSHCSFQWREPWVDNSTPTATVQCQPRTLRVDDQPALWLMVASMKPGEEHPSPLVTYRNEWLGTRSFDGVQAEGLRRTSVIKDSSGQTQTSATEFWFSREMKELISIHISDDPDYGGELRDIHLQEPDPTLFYPPAGYAIVHTSNHP